MQVTELADVKDKSEPRPRALVLWPWILVVAAWTVAGLSVLTNHGYLINHHYLLLESNHPVLIALVVFLACWQVMTVGMMLPSSMPMIYMIVHAGRQQSRPHSVPGAFLAAYALVWTGFALAACVVDMGVNWLTDSWSWLGTYPWVVGVTTFTLAGVFQFSSFKGRCLKQCRSPFTFFVRYYHTGVGAAWRLGLRHGAFCLGCCWALMLIMFGVGVASLAGMAVLAGVMIVEKAVPNGQRMRAAIGVACLVLAVLWLAHPAGLLQSVAGAPLAAPVNAVQVGQTQYAGGYAITLQASPEKPGLNTFVVIVKNGHGAQIPNARVVVETTMLDMAMGTQQVSLKPVLGSSPGMYHSQGELPMIGHWELKVRVQPAYQKQSVQAVFLLTVTSQ